jgi:hypothetical protein
MRDEGLWRRPLCLKDGLQRYQNHVARLITGATYEIRSSKIGNPSKKDETTLIKGYGNIN